MDEYIYRIKFITPIYNKRGVHVKNNIDKRTIAISSEYAQETKSLAKEKGFIVTLDTPEHYTAKAKDNSIKISITISKKYW